MLSYRSRYRVNVERFQGHQAEALHQPMQGAFDLHQLHRKQQRTITDVRHINRMLGAWFQCDTFEARQRGCLLRLHLLLHDLHGCFRGYRGSLQLALHELLQLNLLRDGGYREDRALMEQALGHILAVQVQLNQYALVNLGHLKGTGTFKVLAVLLICSLFTVLQSVTVL